MPWMFDRRFRKNWLFLGVSQAERMKDTAHTHIFVSFTHEQGESEKIYMDRVKECDIEPVPNDKSIENKREKILICMKPTT